MADAFQVIKRYTTKYDREIKKICTPLQTHLGIPIFTYYFVEADGLFGYLTNIPEFNEYYFSQNLYLTNPYFAHPALFRSGNLLCPCNTDDEIQKQLTKKFNADHLFLTLQADEARMEGFIFAHENVDKGGGNRYLPHINLLNQFGSFFKKEAKQIIGKMRAEQFNVRTVRGSKSFETAPESPLIDNNVNIHRFLKHISKLSRQERRCLDLFKQGKSAQATGAFMGISQRTVEHYFESIKHKLGVSSKYDLLKY